MTNATSRITPGMTARWVAGLVGVLALAQGVQGAKLLSLGGSPYFVIAAVTMLAGSVLLWTGHRRTRLVFHILLLATVAWALWETGGEKWGMLARVGYFLGVWVVVLLATRGAGSSASRAAMASAAAVVFTGVTAVLATGLIAQEEVPLEPTAPNSFSENEWPYVALSRNATRFSPLSQITTENVNKLEVAWMYRTGDDKRPTDLEYTFEATPLKVGDTLYLCSPRNILIALEAETGKERWRYDPQAQDEKSYIKACRGVAYFKAPDPVEDCPERIIGGTLDGRVIAVDAQTGAPCKSFGGDGEISILEGLGDVPEGFTYQTSTPAVSHGVIMVGGWVTDSFSVDEPSGAVRAYNAVTGEFVWAWDVGRPDDTSFPPEGEHFTRGTPNVWAQITVDDELGLAYLPTGNATPDYWAGHRTPLLEKYNASLVAVDVKTGLPQWHFQTVHHDIWDYDLPAHSVLFDFKRDGETIPALVQVTKHGQVFVLDRRTGTPLIPVVETPTPQGDLPEGEWLSPTQPNSTVVTLTPPELTEASMWGLTPFDQMACRIDFRKYRYEGLFTPQSVKGTIQYPAPFGTINWGSVSYDEDRELMVANTSRIPFVVFLVPREETDKRLEGVLEAGIDPSIHGLGPQLGAPYGMTMWPMLSVLGIPCNEPPWGLLQAIDLNANQLAWRIPLGTAEDSGLFGSKKGLPITMGMPGMGGPTTTRSGLTFIGAALDNYIRAYETATGKEMWRARLPAGGQASPMTYWSEDSGRQFVVISAGGHDALQTKTGDYVIAFALPVGVGGADKQ